jgi:hypothetical protein
MVKELPFVDPHNIRVNFNRRQNLVRGFYGKGRDLHLGMRNDVLIRIPQVDRGLEDLNLLPRDLRPAQPANQFLALAAEHRAGYDFDPA